MHDIRYITDLRKEDIGKMLAAGNMREGSGIKIRQDGDGYVIELDKDVIVDIIWCYVRAGMISNVANANTIYNTRGKFNLDPNTYS